MKEKGFTLIELLVVIAIIGILASVVLASLNSARAKAQDVKIKAELNQVALALDMYYDKYGTYLVNGGGYGTCGCGWLTLEWPGSTNPYQKSITHVLADEGFLPSGFQEPYSNGSPNYMLYMCPGNQRFSLSATLNNPTAKDISDAQASCNGADATGNYGKNFSVSR